MPAKPLISARDMAYIALSVAVISVCAWISVPAAVPFTMQTFAVFLCAGVLGARRGVAAVALYILLGAVGLPVFSGFNCGFVALFGATGGYITGFLPASLIAGWRSERRSRRLVDIIYMTIALIVCYAFGTFWYSLVYVGGMSGIGAALAMCVVPYIIPDALKIALAALMAPRLRSFLNSRHKG